jgi:hypothetical protein
VPVGFTLTGTRHLWVRRKLITGLHDLRTFFSNAAVFSAEPPDNGGPCRARIFFNLTRM